MKNVYQNQLRVTENNGLGREVGLFRYHNISIKKLHCTSKIPKKG